MAGGANETKLRIVARTGWSALNNGEIIEVSIGDAADGGSLLRVISALTIRLVLVDDGLNRRNGKKVIGLVTDAVATRQPE